MIIGNGLVASSFKKYSNSIDILIFASGVSNSMCQNLEEFTREKDLLLQSILHNHDLTIIYFSTCSIYDSDLLNSAYVKHKLNMESIIKNNSKKYIIFRLSNLVGKTNNPNTIVNFLFNKIYNREHFHLWTRATRNVIDIDDVNLAITYAIDYLNYENITINIANPQSYQVSYLVSHIERYLNKKANYSLMNKGSKYSIDVSKVASIFNNLNINFPNNYFDKLLQKYY